MSDFFNYSPVKRLALFMIGVFFLLLSGHVLASKAGVDHGPPLAFDNYSATNGVIDASCESSGTHTVSCSEAVISDGMLQRQVTVTGAVSDPKYNGTYVQFIMIENGASGDLRDPAAVPFSSARGSLDFTNEDFIKMNNRTGGIASKLSILENEFNDAVSIEERFEYTAIYKHGWAQRGTKDAWSDIEMGLSQIKYTDNSYSTVLSELYDERVKIRINGTQLLNAPIDVDIAQRMQLSDAPADAVQKFRYRKLSGEFQSTSRAFSDGDLLSTGEGARGTNDIGRVYWAANDRLEAIWLGLDGGTVLDSLFGYTRIKNVNRTDEYREASYLSFVDANSDAGWDIPQKDSPEYDDTIATSETNIRYISLFGANEAIDEIFTIVPTFIAADRTANPLYFIDRVADLTLEALNTESDFVTYDSWRVDNGVFSDASGIGVAVACPIAEIDVDADNYCREPILNENGVFQRLVVIAGVEYYQTILVDGNVTGLAVVLEDQLDSAGNPIQVVNNFATNALGFKNETYVKTGTTDTGLASQLHLAERNLDYLQETDGSKSLSSDSGQLVSTVTLAKGWAYRGELSSSMTISQDVSLLEIGGTGSASPIGATSMEELFTMDVGRSELDKKVTMFSRVGTSDGGDGFSQPIEFKSITVTGQYQTTASQIDPFTLNNGDTLLWDVGEALQATWVGGIYSTGDPNGTRVGTVSFSDRSTGDRISSTTVDTSVPVSTTDWLFDPFGEAPVYTGE